MGVGDGRNQPLALTNTIVQRMICQDNGDPHDGLEGVSSLSVGQYVRKAGEVRRIGNAAVTAGVSVQAVAAVRPIVSRKAAVLLGFSVILAGLATPALAQSGVGTSPSLPPPLPSTQPPDTNVIADTSRVYGDDSDVFFPFQLLGGFGVDIRAALLTRYSDNVARTDDDIPLRPGLHSRSDWSIEPSMSLSARRPLGRQALFANFSVGRRFYFRNTLLDNNNMAAGGGLQWQLGGRCGGTVQGGWTQRGTQFASFLDVVPSRTSTVRASINASCASAGGLSMNVGADYADVSNHTDDDLPQSLNRRYADVHSTGVNGGLGYRLSNRGEIGVQGQWRRSKFPHQLLPTGEPSENTITGVNGYAKYRLGRSIAVHGSLGYSRVKQKFQPDNAFSGTVWEAGVDYTGPRLGASVATGRSVNGSSGGFANYSISKFTNATVSYRANSRLSASAGFSHRDNDIGQSYVVPGFELVDNRTLDRYFVGADYRMNRIFSFSLDYSHQRMRTNIEEFRYRENSVVFGIRAQL